MNGDTFLNALIATSDDAFLQSELMRFYPLLGDVLGALHVPMVPGSVGPIWQTTELAATGPCASTCPRFLTGPRFLTWFTCS